jgi:protein-S-isoprenylcysteine O-methyltransferase Ste14
MANDIYTLQVPLALAFTAYFILHSLLASFRVKAWAKQTWPTFMPAYRLSFNLLSLILLLPLVWFIHRHPGPLLWQWTGMGWWLSRAIFGLAMIAFFWSLRTYDNAEFLGLKQLRHGGSASTERLTISTLHRFVRHPWYFLLLVIIWSQDIHLSQLTAYAFISFYLVIGSRFEERKLVHQFGNAYRQYRQRVPALIPLPWRVLSRKEARTIMESQTPAVSD